MPGRVPGRMAGTLAGHDGLWELALQPRQHCFTEEAHRCLCISHSEVVEVDLQRRDFEIASLQVNFNDLSVTDAQASMRLFGEAVLPRLNSSSR